MKQVCRAVSCHMKPAFHPQWFSSLLLSFTTAFVYNENFLLHSASQRGHNRRLFAFEVVSVCVYVAFTFVEAFWTNCRRSTRMMQPRRRENTTLPRYSISFMSMRVDGACCLFCCLLTYQPAYVFDVPGISRTCVAASLPEHSLCTRDHDLFEA